MTISPQELYPLSDKELLERLGGAQANSPLDHAIQSEFGRRASVATAKAAEAQIRAADAAIVTAKWTRVSAVAIALSVIVLAATPIVTNLYKVC